MPQAFKKHALNPTVQEWTVSTSEDADELLSTIVTTRAWSTDEKREVGRFIQEQIRDGWFQTGCNAWHGKFYADYHIEPRITCL
jgi:hypothetical protein